MKTRIISLLLLLAVLASCQPKAKQTAETFPTKQEVLDLMVLTNQYFMDKWPDTGKSIITNKERPSNIWTRAVYYEGLMDLYNTKADQAYLDYAISWGEAHNWGLRDGHVYTRDADNQCCGQTYIDLYNMDQQPERIADITASVDSMLNTTKIDDWDWIDALQMAMPVFAKLTVLTGDTAYSERMFDMYMDTKVTQGLWNPEDSLWWRDADFVPPYTEPNGEDCYWARGNGWVVAALARVIDILPNDPHRDVYEADLLKMIEALVPLQREDGFWNVSLHDPTNFGGKETSGTSLFIYGMAWAINHGLVDEAEYKPVIQKAWNAIATEAIHENGFIGYMQGTGKEPKDGQPVTYTSVPDFEDYGLGCFLMSAAEIYKMAE